MHKSKQEFAVELYQQVVEQLISDKAQLERQVSNLSASLAKTFEDYDNLAYEMCGLDDLGNVLVAEKADLQSEVAELKEKLDEEVYRNAEMQFSLGNAVHEIDALKEEVAALTEQRDFFKKTVFHSQACEQAMEVDNNELRDEVHRLRDLIEVSTSSMRELEDKLGIGVDRTPLD